MSTDNIWDYVPVLSSVRAIRQSYQLWQYGPEYERSLNKLGFAEIAVGTFAKYWCGGVAVLALVTGNTTATYLNGSLALLNQGVTAMNKSRMRQRYEDAGIEDIINTA